MLRLRLSYALLAAALVLAGLPAVADAGPGDDPSQFPALANSKYFQRSDWNRKQRTDAQGRIPDGAREHALTEIERSHSGPGGGGGTVAAPLAVAQPVSGDRWTSIGPAPVLGGQIGTTTGARSVSGRVAALGVDPANPARWLAGGAQGGVWETLDSGTTWTPRTDAQASLATGSIAFAPSAPGTIYVGTGEANFSGDAYAGQGVLKSTDGGATWQTLGTATFGKTAVSSLRVDPLNANTLLAGSTRGFAGRDGGFPPAAPAQGVFRSVDGGLTWTQTLTGEATDLAVDPTSFARQYAGMGDIFASPQNGLFRSTDGGVTWTKIAGPWSLNPAGVGRIELAIAPSNPNVLYVSIQDAFNNLGTDGGLLGLFETTNAWDAVPTWVQIPTGATDNGTGVHGYCGWDVAFQQATDQCWYSHVIAVDPANASVLYAGGVPFWKFDGTTWTEISHAATAPSGGIHADQHALAFAGTRLLVGNDGGVWSSTDGGATWNDHNANLALTQFYDGSIGPADQNFALGGSQDNGTERWTGTNSWQLVFGGDGAGSAISAARPTTDWAVSFQDLGIARTTNGGVSFVAGDGGIDKTNVPFIGRFKKCPSKDDVFIAGTDNVWRTDTFFTSVLPSWQANGPNLSRPISGLAFAASDTTCATYAVGTFGGQIQLTTNGGLSWSTISGGVPARAVTDLAFDPTNANVLYATLSGFNEFTPATPGHVFKTTNALAAVPTWTDVSPPTNIPHNAIVLDPVNPSIVYVGTDLGVWKSTTGGTAWTHMGPEVGLPNVAVFNLQINQATNRLVAFTHGRGAFALSRPSADVSVTQTAGPNPVREGQLLTYTIAVTNQGPSPATGVTLTDTGQTNIRVEIVSVTTSRAGVRCTRSTAVGFSVSCPIGTLDSGASVTITLVVKPEAVGTISNTTAAVANEFDPNPANNTATVATTVINT